MDPSIAPGGAHTGAGMECEEDEGATETTYDKLPFSIPLHCLVGGGREIGSEVEPGEEERGGGIHFKIWVYFFLPYLGLTDNKSN